VRNLLFLISSLDYSGPARRLCLLARGLASAGFPVRVCVLETDTPWVASLRQAGVEVEVLGWKRPIDLQPFFALRHLLKTTQPDFVHAFGPTALRAVQVCGVWRVVCGVMASDLLHGGQAFKTWPLDRWLLRAVQRVVAFGTAEANRYQRFGVATEQIVRVTPGVADPIEGQGDRGTRGQGEKRNSDSPLVPLSPCPLVPPSPSFSEGRVLLAIGPIEAHKGYRDAVWAFDILHYLFDDLRLAFLGDGSDLPRVAEFVQVVGATQRVLFLGKQHAVEPYLRRAAVVWVPSRRGGGVCAALEAMAAGRPVVATNVPELEEIIRDGETGFLVPPGDKASLARQTRLLLGDEALARRLADAGRKRAIEQFSVARMVAEYSAIYG
jgi:glycosyltransferase involved in cell wall biosynthesis